MARFGSAVVMPGLLTGFVDLVYEVYQFNAPNTLTSATFRVTDAPSGGSVTIELHNQEDLAGQSITVTIADGETFGTATGSVAITASLWQVITAESGAAMNLSGEYETSSASGVTDFFTTLALVKLDANISGTDADADRDSVLNSMIAGVTRMMQDWMGRDIIEGTTIEKIDGHGDDAIYTNEYPILTIAALTESGNSLVENTDFESADGDLDLGQIIRLSSGDPVPWPKGRRNITVTYTHGYSVVPSSLVDAATALVVAKYFETVQSGKGWRGLASKGVDPSSSASYDKLIWERETIPAMQPFRKLVS